MNIEFVNYTGKFPNLCSGILTLKIDGVEHKFGFDLFTEFELACNPKTWPENRHDKFWRSTGCAGVGADGEEFCIEGEWEVCKRDLPDFLKPYASEIEGIMNTNIPAPCCGGCI